MSSTYPEETGDCLSELTPGMALTFASTPAHQSTAWTTATTTLGSKSSIRAVAVVGWNVKRDESTIAPSTSSPTQTPESDATQVPLSQSSGGRELSTGAYVGIGLGALVGVIGIITVLLALRIMHSRKPLSAAEQQPPVTEVLSNRASFMGSNRTRGGPSELAGKPPSKYIPGYSTRNAGRPPAEMV